MHEEFHPIFFPFYKTFLVERWYYKESLKYKWLFSRSQGILKLSSIMINTIFFLISWEYSWRSPSFARCTLGDSKMELFLVTASITTDRLADPYLVTSKGSKFPSARMETFLPAIPGKSANKPQSRREFSNYHLSGARWPRNSSTQK